MHPKLAIAVFAVPLGAILLAKSASAAEVVPSEGGQGTTIVAQRYDDRRDRLDEIRRREAIRLDEIRRRADDRRDAIRRDEPRRVWIPGHWEPGFLGIGRKWVEGHWEDGR